MQIQPISMKSAGRFNQSQQNYPVVAASVTNHNNSAQCRGRTPSSLHFVDDIFPLLSDQGYKHSFALCVVCSDPK